MSAQQWAAIVVRGIGGQFVVLGLISLVSDVVARWLDADQAMWIQLGSRSVVFGVLCLAVGVLALIAGSGMARLLVGPPDAAAGMAPERVS